MAQPSTTPVSITSLLGKKVSKTVPFLGAHITINKLTVAEVKDIQDAATLADKAVKAALANPEEDADVDQLGVLRAIVRSAVEGGQELTDENFQEWPIEDISKLAKEIMKYSGIGDDDTGKSSSQTKS
jgi:hypothetical protein